MTVQGKRKRELLAVVRDCFDQLHRPLNNLKPVEILPCNCDLCAKSKDPHPFKYDVIKRRLNDTDVFELCDISDAKVNRRALYADAIDETYIDKERLKQLVKTGNLEDVMRALENDDRYLGFSARYWMLKHENNLGTVGSEGYQTEKMRILQGLLEESKLSGRG